MIFLTDVYKEMVDDFKKSKYVESSALFRIFRLNGKSTVLISVEKSNMACEVSISIPDYTTADSLKNLPKWKGMEGKLITNCNANTRKWYLSFKQMDGYEEKIFFLVLQDVIESVNELPETEVISATKEILTKWNTFFQFDKNYVLSDNVQQGLYGELYLLEKVVTIKGENVINCWTGCNSETHDFYFGKDALEVKTSSAKGPDKVNISNEYQLDDTGLLGRLYLIYLKVKKSEIDGEKLSDIVGRIADMLSANIRLSFYDKLLKVGYVYQMPELYMLCFRTREESCYAVNDGFPRITTKTISKGIGSVDYVVSLNACNSFQISIESYYEGVEL